MSERLAAIKAARLACRELDFWENDKPKCPHCGVDYDIGENEAWHLYDPGEGDHEIECPSCDLMFNVAVHVSFSFSTDEQEEDDGQSPRPKGRGLWS